MKQQTWKQKLNLQTHQMGRVTFPFGKLRCLRAKPKPTTPEIGDYTYEQLRNDGI